MTSPLLAQGYTALAPLVGHFATGWGFPQCRWRMMQGQACAGTQACQGVLALSAAQTARLAIAAPMERRQIWVPVFDHRFQGIDGLLRCLEMLPSQRPAAADALNDWAMLSHTMRLSLHGGLPA